MLTLQGKAIDLTSLEFAPFDYREENPHLEYAEFMDGEPLSDEQLYKLEDNEPCELHAIYMDRLY